MSKPSPMSSTRAKAITLTRLNRKNSPSGELERQVKDLVLKLPQISLREIGRSLQRQFWTLARREPPPDFSFSFDLYSDFMKRDRARMSMAAHIIQQVALRCLPQAQVDHEEFEKSICEGAAYFQPKDDFVLVKFPVAWECNPKTLEEQFKLPSGDAQHVLSVLEDPRANRDAMSLIHIVGLDRSYSPYAAPRWPAVPYQITPAQRAFRFVQLLHPRRSRYVEREVPVALGGQLRQAFRYAEPPPEMPGYEV